MGVGVGVRVGVRARRPLEPDRRHLSVEKALTQQQHKLLAEEGEAGDRDGGLVGVELGVAVE